ncbi:MAG TPA: methyltransferase domain-containing protein [Thermoleophilaceae bacterium]
MAAGPFDFDEVFDEDYLYFYGPGLDAASESDAGLICQLLQLAPGMKVLDVACGHGRIANRLAQRGADVTGLDASELFLERAREAPTDASYILGDMRELPWPDETFDCVISWFTSFGYFDDEDNRRVLAEARRVLRPCGRLLIENNNLVELLPRWLPYVVVERGDDLMVDRPKFDAETGRATTERVVVRDGRVRRFRFSVRMFVAAELGDWLRAAGFDTVSFYGADGERLTAGSRRMITVAQRV